MSRRKKVMVCVTQQKNCERLVARGASHRHHPEDSLFMVHVVKENWRYFGQMKESDAMEYLYEIAKNHDASINVMKAQDIEAKLAEFATKYHIDTIVMGESREDSQQQNMIHRLREKIAHKVHFDIVPLDEILEESQNLQEFISPKSDIFSPTGV